MRFTFWGVENWGVRNTKDHYRERLKEKAWEIQPCNVLL